MEKTIYDLQSADWEKTVEMHYFLKEGLPALYKLIKSGFGVYPEILTLMVSLGEENRVGDILSIAGKYNANALHEWLVAFYGKEEWKQKVIAYKLEKVALSYFSSEECADAEFWNALKWKSDWKSKELLAGKFGVKHLFQICDKWRVQLNRGAYSSEIEARFDDLEHYLAYIKEFTYLYEHKSWKALCRQFDAFKYLADIGDYSAIMACVEIGTPLNYEIKSFVRTTLNNAPLNEAQKERYRNICSGLLLASGQR